MASKIASSSRTLLQSHSRPIPQIIYSSISNTHTHPLLPLNTPRSQYHSTPLRSQIPCPRIKVPSHQLKRRSYTTAPTYTTATNSLLSSTTNGPPPIHNQGTGVRVVPPNLELIKQEGYFDEDVSLVPEGEARLIITPQALNQLAIITSREPPEVLGKGKLALRVGVESGGCHGYQYTMDLTEDRGVDDYVFQPEGVNSIPVVVDLVSLGLLKGSTLHYGTELIGSSFKLLNNPQAKEGGACGCGVSWEAKI